jgi:hypothetical protein
MNNSNKEDLYQILYYISIVIFGLCIIVGALKGAEDGAILVGAFKGFIIGMGVMILNSIVVRSIEDPSRLLAFIIFPAIGYIIGLIWGWDAAKIGAIIGAIIAVFSVADMIKKK